MFRIFEYYAHLIILSEWVILCNFLRSVKHSRNVTSIYLTKPTFDTFEHSQQ